MTKFDYTTLGNTQALKNLCKILEEKNDETTWKKICTLSNNFFEKMKSLRNVDTEHREYFQKLCLNVYLERINNLHFEESVESHLRNFLSSYYKKELKFKTIPYDEEMLIRLGLDDTDLGKLDQFDNFRFEGE